MVLRADENVSTLLGFRRQRTFVAGSGEVGRGGLKRGKQGADVEIPVPTGTEVSVHDGEWRRVDDLVTHGEELVVAKGGRGGKGNARFASSTLRFPVLAEEGDPGEELSLRLDLKLLADVGIIGVPNAGKSTLLSVVSRAKPRIADYPFTTLEPVLGMVMHRERDFVMVEIPGLIEGAHEGAGLGHEFLRHVERTRVLVHLLDGTSDDVVGDYRQVRKEIGEYSEDLLSRPQVVAMNKIDVTGVEAGCREVGDGLGREVQSVCHVSAATKQGLDGLLDEVARTLEVTPKGEASHDGKSREAMHVLSPVPHDQPEVVRKEGDRYEVTSRAATRVAAMIDGSDWNARAQFYDLLRRTGVIGRLEKAGIKPGETVRIGKMEWEWEWE